MLITLRLPEKVTKISYAEAEEGGYIGQDMPVTLDMVVEVRPDEGRFEPGSA